MKASVKLSALICFVWIAVLSGCGAGIPGNFNDRPSVVIGKAGPGDEPPYNSDSIYLVRDAVTVTGGDPATTLVTETYTGLSD